MASSNKILNFTQLSDKDAASKLTELRNLVLRGEGYVDEYRVKANKTMKAWRGKLWTEEDLAFFRQFDLTPYAFRDFRPYINQLIANQRQARFRFDLVPRDNHSYRRHVKALQSFLESNAQDFSTIEEATRYFEEYGDDEYANALTAAMTLIRDENKAKYIESDCFENGLIVAADFLKAYYGNKHNRDGSIVIDRKSIRNMIWDSNSRDYDLGDAEFIGEVHTKYMEELVQMYPEYAEEVREHFDKYTNKRFSSRVRIQDEQFDQFMFFDAMSEGVQAKVVELWTLESEERFTVYDSETEENRIADFGLDEDTIWDALYQKTLMEVTASAEATGDMELLASGDLEGKVRELAETRYELRGTQEPIWYKTVFSYDVLFEHERSPYPHAKHPYTAFFPQYTDGYFSSVMDDIYDVVIALNKALMFREMLMAHGAKGLVLVNQDVMAASGYDVNDIAEAYTQIGGVLALKLKPGQRLSDAFVQQTTLDKGLSEITALIRDYDARLQHITGVTPAQLGIAQGETPASRYRMQISEGQSANNLIFDNFVRSLELFYSKLIPMIVEMMQRKPNHFIRALGDQVRPWINIDIDHSFDLFAESMRTGNFSLTVRAEKEDSQSSAARDAQYMQMALAGAIPIKTAIRNSTDPRRGKILRDMQKDREEDAMLEQATVVSLSTIQQVAAESGMQPEAVKELVLKLQKSRYAELQEQEAQRKRAASSIGSVQTQAADPMRIENQQ